MNLRFLSMPRAVALLVSFSLLAAPGAMAFKRAHEGAVIDDFTVAALGGEPSSLTVSAGSKATVLVFWAAWSARSEQMLTDVDGFYKQLSAEGVGALAVNVSSEDSSSSWPADELKMLEAVSISYPAGLDQGLEIFDKLGVIAVPSALVLDVDHKVVAKVTGYSSMGRDALNNAVLQAMGKLAQPEPQAVAQKKKGPAGKALRYLAMAKRFIKKKRHSSSVKYIEKAIKEDPTYAASYQLLAEAYERMGKPEQAAEAAKKAAELGDDAESSAVAGGGS